MRQRGASHDGQRHVTSVTLATVGCIVSPRVYSTVLCVKFLAVQGYSSARESSRHDKAALAGHHFSVVVLDLFMYL